MSIVKLGLRALNKAGLLRHLTFNVPMSLLGKWTWIPIVKGVGITYVVEFEPFMDALIGRLIPLFPGTFVDVGVNIGQTLIKVKCAFPSQEYLGFEPNSTCVAYVHRLIERNGFTQVRLVPAGLADHDGSAILVLPSGEADDSSATLLMDLRKPGISQREVTVDLMTWRTAERERLIGRLGVIKIDVEGSELFVLQQLEHRLLSDRPITFVEVLPTYEPPDPQRLSRNYAIEALCQRCDLSIHRIHKKEDPIRLERIAAFGTHSHLHWSDHLLVPREREAEVLAAFR